MFHFFSEPGHGTRVLGLPARLRSHSLENSDAVCKLNSHVIIRGKLDQQNKKDWPARTVAGEGCCAWHRNQDGGSVQEGSILESVQMWRCCTRLYTGFMIMSHCTGVDRKHQLIGSNQREKLPALPRRDAGLSLIHI